MLVTQEVPYCFTCLVPVCLACRGKQVALDVARGLHCLHSFNTTHFDLKSGNVLLTQNRKTAKVADVGLARQVHGGLAMELQ